MIKKGWWTVYRLYLSRAFLFVLYTGQALVSLSNSLIKIQYHNKQDKTRNIAFAHL